MLSVLLNDSYNKGDAILEAEQSDEDLYKKFPEFILTEFPGEMDSLTGAVNRKSLG